MRILFALLALPVVAASPWLDVEGRPIQAHSAGIRKTGGLYDWYGEDKTLGTFNRTGVSVYTSTDLKAWKRAATA